MCFDFTKKIGLPILAQILASVKFGSFLGICRLSEKHVNIFSKSFG